MINTFVADMKDEETVAFTRRNSDGTYTIILNARYSRERLEQAYRHELKHIESNDLDEPVSIEEAELKIRGIPAAIAERIIEEEHYEVKVGFTPISQLPMSLIRLLTKTYYEMNPKKKTRERITPKDYYPTGAYDEMKRKKQI